MGRLADPLRERILRLEELGYGKREPTLIQTLKACADQIDAEHLKSMEMSRRETKRAFARYLRAIIEDYSVRNTKRTTPSKSHMLVKMGTRYCSECGLTVEERDRYCSWCGARLIRGEVEC